MIVDEDKIIVRKSLIRLIIIVIGCP